MDISRFLPNEILGIIADQLSELALFRLAQTNRVFSQIAIPRLYRLNAKQKPGSSIIYRASREGRLDIILRAARSGIYVGDFPLARNAAFSGCTKLLDFIAMIRNMRRLRFTAQQLSSLARAACHSAEFNMLSHLFDHFGASLNPQALSNCLLVASANNGKECVQLLLDKGADPSAVFDSESALEMAIRNNHSDIVNILLEQGANVHQLMLDEFSGIHIAAIKGNISILKVLLEHGADPSVAIADGRTPLRLAILDDKIAAACFLIQKTTNHGASMQSLFDAVHHGASI